MRVAYLINQYPQVSHTFVRREILELERRSIKVVRYAVRGWGAPTPDQRDALEKARTSYILAAGARGLSVALLKVVFCRPHKFWNALLLTLRRARFSDRPLSIHLIYLMEACWLLCA